MKSNEMNNDWFDIRLLILFSWNWYLDHDKKLSEWDQVLSHIRRNMIEEEKEMISETKMTKSKNETEHEIEHQDYSDLSLLTFRRK